MAQRIHEYPNVIGKTVAKITVTNESDWHNISVKFSDNTAIHFTIRSFIQFEPEHIDWTIGDGEVLRTYPFVHESTLQLKARLAAFRAGVEHASTGEGVLITSAARKVPSRTDGRPMPGQICSTLPF